jgi:putative transposase
MYRRLGRTLTARHEAYRGLFKSRLDDDVLNEIRGATNGNYVVGSERFQEEIHQMLRRRVVKGKAGQPVSRGGGNE